MFNEHCTRENKLEQLLNSTVKGENTDIIMFHTKSPSPLRTYHMQNLVCDPCEVLRKLIGE